MDGVQEEIEAVTEVFGTLFGGCFWTYYKYGLGFFKFLDGNCRYFPAGTQGLETNLEYWL